MNINTNESGREEFDPSRMSKIKEIDPAGNRINPSGDLQAEFEQHDSRMERLLSEPNRARSGSKDEAMRISYENTPTIRKLS